MVKYEFIQSTFREGSKIHKKLKNGKLISLWDEDTVYRAINLTLAHTIEFYRDIISYPQPGIIHRTDLASLYYELNLRF